MRTDRTQDEGTDLLTGRAIADALRVTDRSVRRWAVSGTLPIVEVGGVRLYRHEDIAALRSPARAKPSAGTAIVCQSDSIAPAIRRDTSVEFSGDAAFTMDGVAARVTMRVDSAPSDPAAFYVLETA